MEIRLMDRVDTAAIRAAVMEDGRIRVLPAAVWESFSWDETRTLMHEDAVYVLPTQELVSFLDSQIGGRTALEIGAGTGYIGRALGIRMTDSYQQRDDPETVRAYRMMRQPLVRYPHDVIKLEANAAVGRYHPQVVVGCYVTHRWYPGMASGNMKGVDFERLLPRVEKLILVGNLHTHADNPIMALPHEEIRLDGLITRSDDPSSNRVFVWEWDSD